MLFPLYVPAGHGGHGITCRWARRRGRTAAGRVYLFIFKKLVTLTSVPRDSGRLDRLS